MRKNVFIERPIIFSDAMIHALRDGRKTQTRRVIKGSINNFHQGKLLADWPLSGYQGISDGFALFRLQDSVDNWTSETVKSRYGKPGDLLWVRETWAGGILGCESQGGYSYKADHITGNDGPFEIKWRSPIHMPRNASRITLQIADIRVERLQCITKEDAIAEGLKESPVNAFHALWDSIHADGRYPWDSNPWVWVVEFSSNHFVTANRMVDKGVR